MLMAIMTLTVFLSTLHGYNASMREVKLLFDSELADKARLLVISGNNLSSEGDVASVADHFAFQIWQGAMLLQRSDNAPLTAITSMEEGYEHRNFNSARWRTFTLHDSRYNRWVMTAEKIDSRNVLAEGIILKSVMPVVAALPVAGLLIWLVVGYGLSPLRNIADFLRNKRADDLRPLPVDRQPVELMQVVTSTNDLFHRLEVSFGRERQFASDAAHELRTPISVLKVHLHNIGQGMSTDSHDWNQLEAAVDRMGNLVDQILTLYRTSPDQYLTQFKAHDLYQLVQEVIISMYPGFEKKNIQLELTGNHATISGDRFALETLVKNLLDNACKYTPAGGHVHASVSEDSRGVTLEVEDSGPGVPEEQYHRIFDRFYRLGGDRHESTVIGCGLGLAIVRHIADLHGASLELRKSSFENGLAISVLFLPGSRSRD